MINMTHTNQPNYSICSVNEDTFWRNYFYRVQSLKQMSDRGEDLIRHGWTSNRSSSGEGPDDDIVPSDEANHVDTASYNFDERNAQNPLCPNLDSSVVREPGLESTESQKLFDEADDLKSKLKELNIGSLDEPGCQDGKCLAFNLVLRRLTFTRTVGLRYGRIT